MQVLITGACGFVGRMLASELAAHGHKLILATRTLGSLALNGVTYPAFPCDIRDPLQIQQLIEQTKPEGVVHLAGLAHVTDSAKDRRLLSETNTLAVHHLCAALSQLDTTCVPVVFASSAFVYNGQRQGHHKINEQTAVDPVTPYGHSKLAAEHIGRCFGGDKLAFYVVRPFNHIGPGQASSFVCSGFASRIHKAAEGSSIEVGNLSAKRDFCDVRDVVRAYRLILEKRPNTRTFVLGSGHSVPISAILQQLIAISGKSVKSEVSPALYREHEEGDLVADTTLIQREVGWEPQYTLEQSLRDLYASL